MSRFRLIIILTALFILALIFLPGYVKLLQLQNENQDIIKQIRELRKQNQNLAVQVQKLKQDPLYLEQVARRDMKIGKKGEVVYRVTENEVSGNR